MLSHSSWYFCWIDGLRLPSMGSKAPAVFSGAVYFCGLLKNLVARCEMLDPRVDVFYFADYMMKLRYFNMNVITINQSYSRVFCATKNGIVF